MSPIVVSSDGGETDSGERGSSPLEGNGAAWWLALLATALTTGFVASRLAQGSEAPPLGGLALGPLVLSLIYPVRETALYAVATSLLGGALAAVRWVTDDVGALLWLLLLCGFAVVNSAIRTSREQQLEQVTAVATATQSTILHEPPATSSGLAFSARYVSAAQHARVGGDLYDVVLTDRGDVRVFVGDVRGKGLEAVQLAVVALAAFREVAHRGDRSLADVAGSVDASVTRHLGDEDFVTAVFCEFRDDEVVMVNCGHPPPLRLHGGALSLLEPDEPTQPLGLSPRPYAQTHEFRGGDRLLLYTDGLVEARDVEGAFLAIERLAGALTRASLDDALDGVLRVVETHSGDGLQDDLALLLVEHARTTAPPQAGEPSGSVSVRSSA